MTPPSADGVGVGPTAMIGPDGSAAGVGLGAGVGVGTSASGGTGVGLGDGLAVAAELGVGVGDGTVATLWDGADGRTRLHRRPEAEREPGQDQVDDAERQNESGSLSYRHDDRGTPLSGLRMASPGELQW